MSANVFMAEALAKHLVYAARRVLPNLSPVVFLCPSRFVIESQQDKETDGKDFAPFYTRTGIFLSAALHLAVIHHLTNARRHNDEDQNPPESRSWAYD